MNEQKLKKKLNIMIATVTLLVCGLVITSAALASSIVGIRNNRFAMSVGVMLNVNDGQPVVDMNDILFEPGGTYISEFSISNLGDFDVWYRVYLTHVEGELKDDITVTIKDADGNILSTGKMNDLEIFVNELAAEEEKMLSIEFYFSPDTDNRSQGQAVSFNVTVDATQKKNNPNRKFGD